jgi:hypothetical protein
VAAPGTPNGSPPIRSLALSSWFSPGIRLPLSLLQSGEAQQKGVDAEAETGLVIGALCLTGCLGEKREVGEVEPRQGSRRAGAASTIDFGRADLRHRVADHEDVEGVDHVDRQSEREPAIAEHSKPAFDRRQGLRGDRGPGEEERQDAGVSQQRGPERFRATASTGLRCKAQGEWS